MPTTLLRILFHDLCNEPMPNLYHEIRENGRTISAGNSDGGGYGVWMRRRIGSVLDIAVKDPKTGAMTTLSARIIVQKPNQSNAYIARVQAPCCKQTITLQPRQGTQGDYRRKTHTVKKGETLEGIAKQYSTTLQILHHLNKDKIKDPNKIQVGWVLKVPPKNSGLQDSDASAGTKTQTTKNTQTNPYTKPKITTSNYQIEKGDTLGSIAQRSGKSISDLQRLNGITDPNKIQAGKYIKTGLPNTPKPAQPTTKPSSQPVPSQASSTSGQSGGILNRVQEVFSDGMDWLDQKTQPIQDKFEQTIDYGSKIFNEGVDVVSQTAGKIKDDALDAVSGLFNDKPSQTQTPSQAPKPTEIKPIQTTEQNQRSQEGGTPKVVVEKQGNCSCNRDLTLSELNHILSSLGVKGTSLFTAENCELNQKERNAETFLKFLNQVFKKYQINTCLRRIHFLAQICHESGRFQTTTEYASGKEYNPGRHNDATANGNTQMGDGPKYRGRGLMQLTWKNNYRLYYNHSGIDVVSNYSLVSTSLDVASDSAGWFWYQGKVLSKGERWKGPGRMPDYLKKYKIDFPKKEVKNKDKIYYSIDMNLVADADQVDTISFLVNGGKNGLTERRKYVLDLKKIFGFPNQCKSVGVVKPITTTTQEAQNVPWMEIAIREGKQWKGVKEGKITDNYHKIVGIPYSNLVGDVHQWCAAFTNSCLKECGYTLPINEKKDIYERVRAHGYRRDKVNFQKISIPVYGAIAVTKKGSHVCFVLGRQNSKNFFRLGGNQGNMITVDVRSIDSYEYFLPMAYYRKNMDLFLAPIITESDIQSRGLNFYETNSTT
ncbi:membrane-bound lytic murein transglycosylase D [Moraxella lacunata]|uniref:Membrane-bound lytic murein transglycosylase D n=1 Tax=Moraxella lacunata TaxID=477 RepID=A0A378QJT7_MORLA|nr:LysM peptidoglycan-binding domain-containing protein [Moraxella lacunata]STZ00732.1 membrane-bound lytic murein transglycosylase D [Moraxella lacunata]